MQSDHEFAPTQIAAADFPTAFRGYDQDAVRHYLTRLASALEENGGDALAALARTTTLDRIEELEEENEALRAEVRDLELELVQRSVDGPGAQRGRSGSDGGSDDATPADEVDSPFDEHRAIELLGKETARVLESARSAAADLVKKAERQAKTIEKDARTELNEARRKSRRLVADKQAEAEELVAKVAAEAEESAERMRLEADEHREMVLAESKKIMGDAEAQAAADERQARARAEQIVGDAEALRQQLLSELVVERTKIRTDLQEMSSTRDRLVMALMVARTELDDMAKTLDDISPKPVAGADVDQADAEAQVEQLVAQLDGSAAPPSETSGGPNVESVGADDLSDAEHAGTGSKGSDDEVIDLTGEPSADGEGGGKPEQGGGGASNKPKAKNRSRKPSRRGSRRGTGPAEESGRSSAATASSSAATALAEPSDEVDTTEPDADPVELVDDVDEVDGVEIVEPADEADAEVEGTASDDAEPDEDAGDRSVELSLIEGFNTIELTEADLGLAHTPDDDADAGGAGDLTIVTVASRESGADLDGNRGDLLIDEDYRGRLPAAIAARDTALAAADDFHRSLRRALNDDQSDVLDRLRGGKGVIEVSELPKFSDQIERYLQPLRDGLAPVALAGAKAGGRREISAGVLDNLVKQLAKYIVDKVRIPVIREVEQAVDHDREKLFEPIRSVYRDFRNANLFDLADDALFESFAIGLYSAIPTGNPVVWMLDPRHDPDPVCEINAGKSGLVKGEKFPSGHVRPLALPNCRCLVVSD